METRGGFIARLRRQFSFVLQQALSFGTRHHLCRQGVSLTSQKNCNNRIRRQEREWGTAVGKFDLQQQVASPRQEAYRNRGININGQDRRTNREGVVRGTVRNNERCNDSVEEADEIEVGNCKGKWRDSVSPLSRLIRG